MRRKACIRACHKGCRSKQEEERCVNLLAVLEICRQENLGIVTADISVRVRFHRKVEHVDTSSISNICVGCQIYARQLFKVIVKRIPACFHEPVNEFFCEFLAEVEGEGVSSVINRDTFSNPLVQIDEFFQSVLVHEFSVVEYGCVKRSFQGIDIDVLEYAGIFA